MEELRELYKLEKGPTVNMSNISEKTQWETLLISSNEKIVQNTMFLAQQWLQEGKGFEIFKSLIYANNDVLVQNTMHLLVNYSNQKNIVEAIKSKGMKRQIEVMKSAPIAKKIVLLQFVANLLTDPTCHETFMTSGGLSFALDLLYWDEYTPIKPGTSSTNNSTKTSTTEESEQINTLGFMILSPLMAARAESRDYSIFSTKECFTAFTRTLLKKNLSDDARRIVLSILANLLSSQPNRKLFSDANGTAPLIKILQGNLKNDSQIEIILTLVSNVIADMDIGLKIVEGEGVVKGLMEFLTTGSAACIQSTLGIFLNLATHEELIERSLKDMVSSGIFEKILVHLRAKNSPPEIRSRAALAISNLMMNEEVQKLFLTEKNGIKTLASLLKTEKDENVLSRVIIAIFHMTMFNDLLRNALIRDGLEELTSLLTSSQTPLKLRKEIVKVIVNLCLGDGEQAFSKRVDLIKALLEYVSKSTDPEFQELSAIALENLSTSAKVNSIIEQNGGYAAAVEFLKSASDSKTRERSALLISRLATNSKMRREFQKNPEVEPLLQRVKQQQLEEDKKGNSGNDGVRKAVLLAVNNVAVPHFENLEPVSLVPQPKEFAEFEHYDFSKDKISSNNNDDDDEIFDNYDDDDDDDNEALRVLSARSASISFPSVSSSSTSSSSSSSTPPRGNSVSSFSTKTPGKQEPEKTPKSAEKSSEKSSSAKSTPKLSEKSTKSSEKSTEKPSEKLGDKSLDPDKRKSFRILETQKAKDVPHADIPDWQRKMLSRNPKSTIGGNNTEEEVVQKMIDPTTGEEVEDRSLSLEFYAVADDDADSQKKNPKEQTPSRPSKILGGGTIGSSGSSTSSGSGTIGSSGENFASKTGTYKSSTIGISNGARFHSTSINTTPKGGGSITTKPRSSSGGSESKSDKKLSEAERLNLAKMHFRRTRVAQELLDTEGTYVRNLAIVIKKFQNPLFQIARTKKPLLPTDKIRLIFSSIEIIFGCNTMLLEGLNQRMARWSSKQYLGDVFLYMADFFRVYTEYINNFDKAQKELIRSCSDSKLSKWLENVRVSDVCAGQSLMSFLIMPVQRMPRYELLLKELQKATPNDHPDAEHLKNAIQRITDVNTYLNSKKKEADDHFKMIELAEKLVGKAVKMLLTPRRNFIWEAEITWSDTKHEAEKGNDGSLLMFNDVLVITKMVKKKYKIIHVIPYAGIQPKWQGEQLSFRYDALKVHMFDIKFKTKPGFLNTKQRLDGVCPG